MKFTQRARGIVQAIAVVLSLALPLMLAISSADARIGGGISSGSRGTRTFSAPPSTSTAPGTAQPFNRTITQPGSPGHRRAGGGGRLLQPARLGMLGGLAAGFLGAGLFGMLFGGGMFGGLGGLSSIFGLILQIGLIVIVVRLAMSWWQRRHATASAYAGAAAGRRLRSRASAPDRFRTGIGQRAAGDPARPTTKPSSGCSATSRPPGRTRMSPSCTRWRRRKWCRISRGDLEQNKARNVINKVSDTKLLQGDLAGSLARRRYRLCQRGDAVLAGRQDRRPHHGPAGRGQRSSPPRPPKCGPSCGRAARAGSSRRSSRPDRRHTTTMTRRRGSFRGAFSSCAACGAFISRVAKPE